MRLHIGICDDEISEIRYLKVILEEWSKKSRLNLVVDSFENAESFLFSYPDCEHFDILLLDIQMKQIDGVSLAKRLRAESETAQIIFITGFADFAAEGYEVEALHYLMKPVEKEKLYSVLDKAVLRINKNEPPLFLDVDGEILRIPLSDILYCESMGHEVSITTKLGTYNTKLAFASLEQQLNESFFRCHRSYIVGVRHIKIITKTDVILDNGKSVPISRRLYHETNQAFIRYFKAGKEI